jgi:3-phenylpropionate/trans-cinnamate dioxygenase ferredoxin reductase subunit
VSFIPHWAPAGTPACRIESVQNANDMAKTAAASIVGRSEAYRALPWFWSDQYNLKLQMAGMSTGFIDFVLRGSVEDRRFSLFYFRDEKLIAVDSINRPQDHMLARKLLATGNWQLATGNWQLAHCRRCSRPATLNLTLKRWQTSRLQSNRELHDERG